MRYFTVKKPEKNKSIHFQDTATNQELTSEIQGYINKLKINQHELPSEGLNNDDDFIKKKKNSLPPEDKLLKIHIAKLNYNNPKKNKNKFKTDFDVAPVSVTNIIPNLEYKKRTYLLIKPGMKWYDQNVPNIITHETPPAELVSELEKKAAKLLEDEVELYTTKYQKQRLNDFNWIKNIISTGTLMDKMAAITIVIQDSPIHCLHYFDLLINMCKKKDRRENLLALATLKDLLLNDLLPDNQKLKKFSQHPLHQLIDLSSGNKDTFDRYLIYWYFEHQLKERYLSFLKVLETISYDVLVTSKTKALVTMYALLTAKPEQEQVLLNMLINKLGEPLNKIASRAVYFLSQLITDHPNMKTVVVSEVERFLYRPNVSARSQYYAVCFLNGLVFLENDDNLAAKLITLYLSFFKVLTKKKEVDFKMLSALLVGVNRAFYYAKEKSKEIIQEASTLFKLVQTTPFVVSIQTLMLLYHLVEIDDTILDRFYVSLYRKLLDFEGVSSSHQTLFLNLIFKSLKRDSYVRRVKAFVKRLFLLCSYNQPPFICGILIIISQIIHFNPSVMEIVQLQQEDSDDEHFVDVKLPNSDTSDVDDTNAIDDNSDQKNKNSSSWFHRKNIFDKLTDHSPFYNPLLRNPLYCGGEYCVFWELHYLCNHYHPSVALFAQKILKGERIVYTGDPIEDFTSSNFLERFIRRNPKNSEKKFTSFHEKKVISKNKSFIAYGKQLAEKKESNILPHELFLYKYFKKVHGTKKLKKEFDYASDQESISDDEFDAYLDQMEYFTEKDKNLDFLNAFEKENKKKKKKIGSDESDDDFDDDGIEMEKHFETMFEPDEDNFNEEEMTVDDNVEFHKTSKPKLSKNTHKQKQILDEEDFIYSDDEFVDSSKISTKQSKSRKKQSLKEEDFEYNEGDFEETSKNKKKSGFNDLFAAAEKFSNIIDEDNYDTSGADAFSNKDKSSKKQLKWEMERDQWIRGVDWKSRKRMKRKSVKKPFFKKNRNKK